MTLLIVLDVGLFKLLIYLIITLYFVKSHFTFRYKYNFDVDRYCTDLNDSIFNFMLDSEEITETNFDDSFEAFVSIIQHTIDKHAPLKRMSRKQKKKIKRKPWITRNIYQLICLKNKMHRTHYIKGDAAMMLKYKKFSNNQSINFLDPLILGGSRGQQLKLKPPSISILCNKG